MQFIVACDKNWGIGYQGEMLFHLPEDLAFFKRVTMDSVVVMGRKTFESLPGSKALVGRINIVLSKDEAFKPKDAEVVCSIAALDFLLESKYSDKKVFLIGGGRLYESLLYRCSGGYVTHVEAVGKEVDTYFPNLSLLPNWQRNALMKTENKKMPGFQVWHYENLAWRVDCE